MRRSAVFVRSGVVALFAASSIGFVHPAAAADDPVVDAGPRTVTSMTTRQVVDQGRNEQVVQLQGRIASHDGGQNYTFRDHAGTLPVYIARAQLPGKQVLASGQRVELVGQIHKEMRHKLEFRVKQVRLVK